MPSLWKPSGLFVDVFVLLGPIGTGCIHTGYNAIKIFFLLSINNNAICGEENNEGPTSKIIIWKAQGVPQ